MQTTSLVLDNEVSLSQQSLLWVGLGVPHTSSAEKTRMFRRVNCSRLIRSIYTRCVLDENIDGKKASKSKIMNCARLLSIVSEMS